MGLFTSFRNPAPAPGLRTEVGQRLAALSDEDFARFLEDTPVHQRPAALRLRRAFLPAETVAP